MKIIVQNLATEYSDQGSGPVLLMLHGWKDNLHSFDSLAALLSDKWRIVRLDLPGFGGSEKPKEVWDLGSYVQFVRDFVQKLNIDIKAVAGHSFGGRIAIKGSASGKLEAGKIILIASAGNAKRNTPRNKILKVLAKIGKLLTIVPPLVFWRQPLRRKLYEIIGSDYFSAGSLKDTYLRVIREDLSPVAGKISCPVLLIWGEKDTETPLTDGERLAVSINNSTLKVIKEAGHFVHQENSEETDKLINEFLIC